MRCLQSGVRPGLQLRMSWIQHVRDAAPHVKQISYAAAAFPGLVGAGLGVLLERE